MSDEPSKVGPEAGQLIQAILKPIVESMTRASLGVTADGIHLSHQTQFNVETLDPPFGVRALRASDTLAPHLILDLLVASQATAPDHQTAPWVQLLYDAQNPLISDPPSTETSDALIMSAFWRIENGMLTPMPRAAIIAASQGSLEQGFSKLTHVDAWHVEGY